VKRRSSVSFSAVVCKIRLKYFKPLLFFTGLFFLFCSFHLLAAHATTSGREIFEGRCKSCHTIGKGDKIGPDLAGVTERRDEKWLVRFLAKPSRMFLKKDPVAMGLLHRFKGIRMPDLGLSAAEVKSLIDYFENNGRSGGKGNVSSPGDMTVRGADGKTGAGLFLGTVPMKNGGPPCYSCHQVSWSSSPGGTLGPDLTQAYDDYDEDGLISLLAELPFPAMKAVYEDHLITPGERAGIVAYLHEGGKKEKAKPSSALGFLVGGGFLIFIGIIGSVWRNRLKDVRITLVRKRE